VTRLSVDQKQVLAQRYAEDERQRVQSALSSEVNTASSNNSDVNSDVNNDDNNDDTASPPSSDHEMDLPDVQSPVSSPHGDDEHTATSDSSGS